LGSFCLDIFPFGSFRFPSNHPRKIFSGPNRCHGSVSDIGMGFLSAENVARAGFR
jgi:hypothetical protein